jgi:flavin-binding protein dodecin
MAVGRVARVTQVIAGSPSGFDDAVKLAFERANATLRNITGLKITEFRVMCEAGEIQEYRVTADVIFVLE